MPALEEWPKPRQITKEETRKTKEQWRKSSASKETNSLTNKQTNANKSLCRWLYPSCWSWKLALDKLIRLIQLLGHLPLMGRKDLMQKGPSCGQGVTRGSGWMFTTATGLGGLTQSHRWSVQLALDYVGVSRTAMRWWFGRLVGATSEVHHFTVSIWYAYGSGWGT